MQLLDAATTATTATATTTTAAAAAAATAWVFKEAVGQLAVGAELARNL